MSGISRATERVIQAKAVCVVLTLGFAAATGGFGATRTLVVPNGFDQLEGNSWITANMEDDGPPGFRQQVVVSHHQFTKVGGPIWITEIRTRPDVQVTGPRTFTYFDIEWYISTTEKTPRTLSTRFSENTGPDEKRVFSGDWVLSTEGGPGLKDFDYVLQLDEPFYYDPSQGDLLVDFVCDGGYSGTPTNSSVMDGQWISEQTHFASVIAADSFAMVGEPTWTTWTPIQSFTYYPAQVVEVTGDVTGDGQVDGGDIQMVMDAWRTNTPSYDIAPEPDGDGLVDEEDLIMVVSSLDADLPTTADESNSSEEGNDSGCRATDTERFLTVPNGFDTLEGNSWTTTDGEDIEPPGHRLQELISHCQFQSVPGPIWITAAHFRPDLLVTGPREFTFLDFELRLSTTQKTPATISRKFTENVGADETLVFSGDCTVSTVGRDGPEDFDYVYEYERPFYYDPSKGDLLIDWVIRGGFDGDDLLRDGQWFASDTHFAIVQSVDPDADTADELSDNWCGIYRFSYRPALYSDSAGDLNADGQVDCADVCFLGQHWGTADVRCDLAPAAGDGVVDERDLLFLVTYLGLDHPVAHWRFDETEGHVARDSAGGLAGFAIGEPTWRPDGGCLGGAIVLDGVNDFVGTANSVAGLVDSPFSVVVWIQGGAPGQVVIAQDDGSDWLLVSPLDGSLMTRICGLTRATTSLLSNASVTDGRWHRVALVWDGSSRALYVDGEEVARDALSQVDSEGGPFVVGAGANLEPGSFWSGLIDDVRIYDRAVRP